MFESPRAAFGAGARIIAPILFAVLPFAMVIGAISADVGLSFVQTVAMSVIVFAGTAQLVALELLNANAIIGIIVFSAFMVNLRHMIYSASLSRHLKSLSYGWKSLLSSFILWLSRWNMPDWLQRALNFVPAAVFSALIAPAILRTNNNLDISLFNPKLLAALVAVMIAWYYRGILPTIIGGMVALWAATWLI